MPTTVYQGALLFFLKRRRWPTAFVPGHSREAMVWLMTMALADDDGGGAPRVSSAENVRPAMMGMPITAKYSLETELLGTTIFGSSRTTPRPSTSKVSPKSRLPPSGGAPPLRVT